MKRSLTIATTLLLVLTGCGSSEDSPDVMHDPDTDLEISPDSDIEPSDAMDTDVPDVPEPCGGETCCSTRYIQPGTIIDEWLLPPALFEVDGLEIMAGASQASATGTLSVGTAMTPLDQMCDPEFAVSGAPCIGDTLLEVDTGTGVVSVVAAIDTDLSAWNDGREVTLTVVGGDEIAPGDIQYFILEDADGLLLAMVDSALYPAGGYSLDLPPLTVSRGAIECVQRRDTCDRLFGLRSIEVMGDTSVTVETEGTQTVSAETQSWDVTLRRFVHREGQLEGVACADANPELVSFEVLRTQ